MAAYIRDLQNPAGDTIYPTTKTAAVWNEEGENLDVILASVGGTIIIVSATQPASPKDGDLWYQII